MKSTMNTHLGNISIDSEVIANYAGTVANEGYRRCRQRRKNKHAADAFLCA